MDKREQVKEQSEKLLNAIGKNVIAQGLAW